MSRNAIITSFFSFFSGVLTAGLIFIGLNFSSFNKPTVVEEKTSIRSVAKENSEIDHSMHSMPMMNDMLQDYTDNDFLELMIIHHQDAVDMANNAIENSKNSFIIELSKQIIRTQTAEISQMEQELENVNN